MSNSIKIIKIVRGFNQVGLFDKVSDIHINLMVKPSRCSNIILRGIVLLIRI
jgi:hypothetical protein